MKIKREVRDAQVNFRVSKKLWQQFQAVATHDYQAPASIVLRQLMMDVVKQAQKEQKNLSS